MTTPLSDTRLTFRAEILAALSAAGAYCGECGFQPGETGCADCVRVRELYADAVMPTVDRLRAELSAWQSAQDAVMALADDANTPVTLAHVAKAHAHGLLAARNTAPVRNCFTDEAYRSSLTASPERPCDRVQPHPAHKHVAHRASWQCPGVADASAGSGAGQ